MDVIAKLKLIEKAFSDYLMNKDKDAFCNRITSSLQVLSEHKKIEIAITDNKYEKEPFYGMRVFPHLSYIECILKDITTTDRVFSLREIIERWRNINSWAIEIDDRIFNRSIINFNPQELTAMLLHEVGHTIYSEKKAEIYFRCLLESKIHMTIENRAAVKTLYKLYMIPLTLMCGFRKWKIKEKDLKEEVFADLSVSKMGYGEYLISGFEKIIKVYGVQMDNYDEETLLSDTLESSFKLCNINIIDIIHRKNKLKDELYHTGIKTNSNFIRKILKRIMTEIGINKKEKYTGNIVIESYGIDFDDKNFLVNNDLIFNDIKFNNLIHKINLAQESARHDFMKANEGFLFKRGNKLDVPTQYDVDSIYVEVDRIANHADRRYVLDLIYGVEDRIQNILDLCEIDSTIKSKYYSKMNNLLRQLSDLRRQVLNKRSFDKQYKLFVRYPSGYEG